MNSIKKLVEEYILAIADTTKSVTKPAMPKIDVSEYNGYYNRLMSEICSDYAFTDSFDISEEFLTDGDYKR